MKHDFGLQIRSVPSTALEVDGPDVAPYEWKPNTREDEQKEEYMGYIRDIFPLDEGTGVCVGGTLRLCMCVWMRSTTAGSHLTRPWGPKLSLLLVGNGRAYPLPSRPH